ncbi:MAG: helix-turn-helix domain-containing protein [Faecalibacterium sp.]|jgi:transcriptional regulator with XRE-family HTH domain|nr:helix-turn-helix domain-containing protein [Faecalibacterium sp.]
MAIGWRIKHIRQMRKITQKELGVAVSLPRAAADIRLSQYESESRIPKEELSKKFAAALHVNPMAIQVPDIDTINGVMHTLFALEDMYGLKVDCINGSLCLRWQPSADPALISYCTSWKEHADLLKTGAITQEQYDEWRYNFPTSFTKECEQLLVDAKNNLKQSEQ